MGNDSPGVTTPGQELPVRHVGGVDETNPSFPGLTTPATTSPPKKLRSWDPQQRSLVSPPPPVWMGTLLLGFHFALH